VVANQPKTLNFLSMDSYSYSEMHSNDSEELYRRCGAIVPENATCAFSLVGIADTYNLAKAGLNEEVLESIQHGGDIQRGLSGACWGGHMETALMLIKLGADCWNDGLESACKGGQPEMVLLMSQKGASSWYRGLYGACIGGHKELVLTMIYQIESLPGSSLYWNKALLKACGSGHEDIALILIEKGANDWDGGLEMACSRNHKKLAKTMAQKASKRCRYCYKSVKRH
jgi:hypothetical protein